MRSVIESVGAALARRSWTLYNFASFRARTQIGGDSFRIPVGQGRGLQLLDFTPREERYVGLLRRLLAQSPGCVVDIGANVGRFLLCVAAGNRGVRYYGFEVQPACVAFIRRVIAENELKASHAFAVGLSDRMGVLTLRTGSDDDVSATVAAGFYPESRFDFEYPVVVVPADAVLEELDTGVISLVKIDVEGGELEVLRGLERTIETHGPSIVIEIAPYAQAADAEIAAFRKERVLQVEALLRSLGYAFAKIQDGDRLRALETLDPGSSTDTLQMDYLCTPVGRAPDGISG